MTPEAHKEDKHNFAKFFEEFPALISGGWVILWIYSLASHFCLLHNKDLMTSSPKPATTAATRATPSQLPTHLGNPKRPKLTQYPPQSFKIWKGHKRFYFITITDFLCNICLEVSRYFSFFGRGETGTEVWKLRLEETSDSCDSSNIPEKIYRKANDVNKFPSVGLPCFTRKVMVFWSWVGERNKTVAFLMNYTSKLVHNYFCKTNSPTRFIKAGLQK